MRGKSMKTITKSLIGAAIRNRYDRPYTAVKDALSIINAVPLMTDVKAQGSHGIIKIGGMDTHNVDLHFVHNPAYLFREFESEILKELEYRHSYVQFQLVHEKCVLDSYIGEQKSDLALMLDYRFF